MTVFYFTATGNSLAVAKRIGGTLISIPQIIDHREPHYQDDALGVVFPVYSLAPPRMVSRFLDTVTFKADYLFAIGTYGNLPGPCMYNLQRRAEKRGFRFDYLNGLLMVDNFLPVFEMEAEAAKLPKKRTEAMTARIIADLQSRRPLQATAGLVSRTLAAALKALGSRGSTDKNAQRYLVNNRCVKCGVCATVCPTSNITVTGQVRFGAHCEGCLACVHHCPQNALHLTNERSGRRWRNPEVSLDEIINANHRR